MSDFLLSLSRNPGARRVVTSLGLPLPMPEPLRRAEGPWRERELSGLSVAIGGADAAHAETLRAALAASGADVRVDPPAEGSVDVLVLDARGIGDVSGLATAYEWLHPRVGRLSRCGRVVVIARTGLDTTTLVVAAALEGFVRSLAKEIGRRGATANLVLADDGANPAALTRFLASRRSAFVTTQPIRVRAGDAPDVWAGALAGRVVLLTGAARGIGASTAVILAGEGAHVVCLDRPGDEEPLREVAASIRGTALPIDITDADAPARIHDFLRERFGGVDVVIHNAGITRDRTLAKMTRQLWDQAIDVNLGAVMRITRELCDGTLRDGGAVVLLSSVAGIAGNLGQTNYAASKAGIAAYARALAQELAPRGISVNAIAPGFIETRLTAAIPVMIREGGRRLSALGQGGQPEDVGQMIAFLATPAARTVTGQVIRVCGGALIGA